MIDHPLTSNWSSIIFSTRSHFPPIFPISFSPICRNLHYGCWFGHKVDLFFLRATLKIPRIWHPWVSVKCLEKYSTLDFLPAFAIHQRLCVPVVRALELRVNIPAQDPGHKSSLLFGSRGEGWHPGLLIRFRAQVNRFSNVKFLFTNDIALWKTFS